MPSQSEGDTAMPPERCTTASALNASSIRPPQEGPASRSSAWAPASHGLNALRDGLKQAWPARDGRTKQWQCPSCNVILNVVPQRANAHHVGLASLELSDRLYYKNQFSKVWVGGKSK